MHLSMLENSHIKRDSYIQTQHIAWQQAYDAKTIKAEWNVLTQYESNYHVLKLEIYNK